MKGQVLWALDNEIDGKTFERLCADLLLRNGYRDIVPVGGVHDRGRDAELFVAEGAGRSGEMAFFQFSLQKDWKKKLESELAKVSRNRHTITTYVFVSSQEITGADRDKLAESVDKTYGWRLQILTREWFRLQLEEAHPDLAFKYFGIETVGPSRPFVPSSGTITQNDEVDGLSRASDLMSRGEFDQAALILKSYLDSVPDSLPAIRMLAWAEYTLFRYQDALATINRALRFSPQDRPTLEIRACILAEYGISHDDEISIAEANRIFGSLIRDAEDWTVHYNYANTLGALGKHQEAVSQYQAALKIDADQPEIWKNLGSSYHQLGSHDEEMRCLNAALDLNPAHAIALFSKGVSMLVDRGEPAAAMNLMEEAVTHDQNLGFRWSNTWYWLAEAHRRSGDLPNSLAWIDRGLLQWTGNPGLRALKSQVLSALWRKDRAWLGDAARHFEFVIGQSPLDYGARAELVALYEADSRAAEAWRLLDDAFRIMGIDTTVSIRDAGFSVEQCCDALALLPEYMRFRSRFPVSDYWDTSEPIYGIEKSLPPVQQFEDAVTVYSSVPFGLGISVIAAIPVIEREESTAKSFFDAVSSGLETCLPRAARMMAVILPSAGEPSTLADKLTDMIMFMGVVALREFGRQRGWIRSIGIPEGAFEAVMNGYDEQQIEAAVASQSLLEINDVAQVLGR